MLKILSSLGLILATLLLAVSYQLPSLSDLTSVNLDSPFSLKEGQTVSIADNFRLKFVKVEEDSRCPQEVQCFWPGQIKVRVAVSQQQQNSQELTLTMIGGQTSASVSIFNNYSLQLISLEPYPQKGQQPEALAYCITLVVKLIM